MRGGAFRYCWVKHSGTAFSSIHVLRSEKSGTAFGAVGAQAPVHDLGLVDHETVVVGRGQARRMTDSTVDIGDDATRPADDVMMVVPDPRLIPRHQTVRLNPPYQSGFGERTQYVIHGLVRHLGKFVAHGTNNRVRVRMRVRVYGAKHRQPRPSHPERGPPQQPLQLLNRRHAPQSATLFWNESRLASATETQAHRFPLLSTYDGHLAGVGRVVCDPTWHHFTT